MRPVLTSYLAVAGLAAVVTLILVPLVRLLAVSTNLLVDPDSRRLHDRPTPYLGGVAMYVGFVVAFVAAWMSGRFDPVFSSSTEPAGVLAGATIAWLVGLIDDIKDISAPAKTAGLSLAGVLLVIGGVSIIWFRIPFLDVFVLPYDLALLFSVIWVLGMANAVNFIDGLDGLAAGIVGIGATAFLLYGFRLGQVELILAGNIGPLVAALVLGICLGFLPWNVYPARIFMGDSGSLLLGTLMAASTMAVGGRTPDPFSGQTFFFYAPLAIPLLILGVPILDTAFAIIRRATHRQGLATADKDHLHHRLVRLGHGHRRSVGILWSWTALLSAFVLYPTYNEGKGDGIVPMGVGALALLLFTLFHPGIKADRTEVVTRRTRLANLKAATDLGAVARIRAARSDRFNGASEPALQAELMLDHHQIHQHHDHQHHNSEHHDHQHRNSEPHEQQLTTIDRTHQETITPMSEPTARTAALPVEPTNGHVGQSEQVTIDTVEVPGPPAIVRPPKRRPISAAATEVGE